MGGGGGEGGEGTGGGVQKDSYSVLKHPGLILDWSRLCVVISSDWFFCSSIFMETNEIAWNSQKHVVSQVELGAYTIF